MDMDERLMGMLTESLFELTQTENMQEDDINNNVLSDGGAGGKRRLSVEPEGASKRRDEGSSGRGLMSGTFSVDPISGRSHYIGRRVSRWAVEKEEYPASRSIFRLLHDLENETEESKRKKDVGPKFGEKSALADDEMALWVDKYAPKKFTDLVSSDRTNVEVLKWVSQWKNIETAMGQSKNADPRPEKKIMLISGPPGLGKTTLVQVIARVAGFHLVEINASDERTGDVVQQKIASAVQSNTIRAMPNLVLIDEIDGAASTSSDSGLIKYLLRLASSGSGSSGSEPSDDGEEAGQKRGTKRKNRDPPLCRPIICICNDLYAPALKPLRPVAHLVQLYRPGSVDLAKRLRVICEEESLRVDGKQLVELVDMMDGDLRACLHALQFLGRTRSSLVGREMSLGVALKDVSRSDHSLLPLLLHKQQPALPRDTLLRLLASADGDRLIDACHHVFPHTKFFDDAQMGRVGAAYDWLAAADCWRTANVKHHFALSGYIPYAPLKFHHLFASPAPPPPLHQHLKAEQEHVARQRRNEAILKAYARTSGSRSNQTELLLERAPLLIRIIRPTSIRAPNPQLLKPSEKLQLARIVGVMAGERLEYGEVRAEDGSYTFIMEPALDLLTGLQPSLPLLSHHEAAIRKLVAHQVHQELICIAQRSRSGKLGTTAGADPSTPKQPQLPPPTKAIRRDFFGRPIHVSEAQQIQEDALEQHLTRRRIYYRFNEGFSNAVRRTIRIKELLGLASTDTHT